MKTTTRVGLMAQATALQQSSGVSLFRAMNLVQLSYLEPVVDAMTEVQRYALSVATKYWRDGLSSAEELDAAGTAVWEAMMKVSPRWRIIGLEVHMARAIIGVMASEFDEGMGEAAYCQELAEWFPKLMWDWCDLSVEECLCLSNCMDMAVRAGRLKGPENQHAIWGATMLRKHAAPGACVDIGEFMVSVPVDTVPEQPPVFGDLSLIGTAVSYVAASHDDHTAAKKTKSALETWSRLKRLFADSGDLQEAA